MLADQRPSFLQYLPNPPRFLKSPPPRANGYDATILIDVCKAILKAGADGKLTKSQSKVARQAAIIVNASAKAGIQGLVYALAGYDRTKEEIIAAYKLYVWTRPENTKKNFLPSFMSNGIVFMVS